MHQTSKKKRPARPGRSEHFDMNSDCWGKRPREKYTKAHARALHALYGEGKRDEHDKR